MNTRQRSWLLPAASLFLIAGILIGRRSVSPWPAVIVCAPVLFAIILARGWLRFAGCMLLSMALGTTAGSLAWHPSVPPEGDYEVRGIISSEIRYGNFGQVRMDLSDVTLNGRSISSGAYWSFYTDGESPDEYGLRPGRMVTFQGELYTPSGADNPDDYDFREDLLRRGITVGLYGKDGLAVSDPSFFSFFGFTASLRHSLTRALITRMGEESGSYTAALLLGQRSLIPAEDRAAFSRLGIAHILSVSGFHVGILIALLSFLFHLLHLKPGLRLGLYAAVLGLYCALCGMSVPVIRASLLLLVTFGGKLLNRPRTGLHSLCAVLCVMLLFSPVQITGASFQLTFAAVLGLTLITPGISLCCPFRRRFLRKLWDSCAVVLGAHIGILLPVMYWYQKLPLLGLLISIPMTAFASVLIALDWFVLLLLPVPGLSGILAGAASAATTLMTDTVRSLSSLPAVTLWTPSPTLVTAAGILLIFTALCTFLRFSAKARAALLTVGAAITVWSLFPVPHTSTEYIQFSSGNADAAVLWDQDRVVVMDTGLDDGIVSGFLRQRRLVPDALILTHLHTDHAGGLRSMISDEIPIPLLYLPVGAEDQLIHEDVVALLAELRASGTEIRYLGKGDTLSLPSGNLSVLWPEKGKTRLRQDANHYSLVSLLNLKGVTMLQAGDITGEYELYAAVPADILKAPHHGSPNSSSAGFLSVVSPEAVILSCRNISRHVDYESRLPESAALWSTARSGALTLRFDDNSVTVIPFKPSP